MPNELTEQEQQLALSAKDAQVLIALVNSEGWKVIKELYFDVTIKDAKEYLADVKNIDINMIQAKRELLNWVQKLLEDIQITVDIGLGSKMELAEILKEKAKEK